MNKIILACFQDDRFSLIFEPLVSELLMIKACSSCMDWRLLAIGCTFAFCLLVTFFPQKAKLKFKTQVFFWRFSIARFLCLVFSAQPNM